MFPARRPAPSAQNAAPGDFVPGEMYKSELKGTCAKKATARERLPGWELCGSAVPPLGTIQHKDGWSLRNPSSP